MSGSVDLTSSGGAAVPWSVRLGRSAQANDVVVLVAVAAAVQFVYPHRNDWPAHVIGGGALVLLLAAATPRRSARWVGLWSGLAVAVLAVLSDLTVTGPFDAGDVAFTVAGAALVADGASELPGIGSRARFHAATWAIVLSVVALAYRYGLDVGP